MDVAEIVAISTKRPVETQTGRAPGSCTPRELRARWAVCLVAGAVVAVLLGLAGCDAAYPENQCARSCGDRGYTYLEGRGGCAPVAALCVCGGAESESAR
jgi:hypothetical protein